MCALLRPLSLLLILYCLIPSSALQPSITILSEQLYDLSVNLAKSNLVQLDEVVTSSLNLVIVTMESMSREKFAEHFKEDLIRKWKQLTLVHESIQKIENLDRRIITQLVSSASKLIRNIQEATGSRDHLDEDIDQNQLTGNSMYYCYRRQTGIVSRPDAEALGWWVFNVAEWMGLSENEAQRDDLYDQAIKVGEQFEAIIFQELSGLEERVHSYQSKVWLTMLIETFRLKNKEHRMTIVMAWKNFVDKLETVGGVKLSLGLLGFSWEQYMNDICDSVVPLIRMKVNCCSEEPGLQRKTLPVTGRLRMVIEGIQDF